MNVSLPQRDEDLYDDAENAQFNQAIVAYDQQRIWKEEFIGLGGFTHLLHCFVELSLSEIRSSLELKVIHSLVCVIF